MSDMTKCPELFPYKPINGILPVVYENISDALDALLEISKSMESPYLREIKPCVVLALKWRFDYLSKTGESPFALKQDVNYWINFLRTSARLSEQNWFHKEAPYAGTDPWERTRKAFNYMWPRNTNNGQHFISSKIATLRVEQIVSMLPGGSDWLSGKTILDAGCGPGRYVSALLGRGPKKVIGIDSGKDIMAENSKRFADHSNVGLVIGSADQLSFSDNSFDFVVSAGVLHHLSAPIEESIREHSRVLSPGGHFFIFIVGSGGLELKLWEFMRNFLYDIPVEEMFNRFNGKIHPLRLQGLLDHSYGEYQHTAREDCERWLSKYFSSVRRVPGIPGLDVTPEIYQNDPYFEDRFGTGNLRYLCEK